jgi:hypothetical protein
MAPVSTKSPSPDTFLKCGPVLGIRPAKKVAAEDDDEQQEQQHIIRSIVLNFSFIYIYHLFNFASSKARFTNALSRLILGSAAIRRNIVAVGILGVFPVGLGIFFNFFFAS